MKPRSGQIITADYLNKMLSSATAGLTGTGGRGFYTPALMTKSSFYVTEMVDDDDGDTSSRVVFPPYTIFNRTGEQKTQKIDDDLVEEEKISIIAVENEFDSDAGNWTGNVPEPFTIYIVSQIDDTETYMADALGYDEEETSIQGFVIGEAECQTDSNGKRKWVSTNFVGSSSLPFYIYLENGSIMIESDDSE